MAKIGVFVCQCGNNIARTVDTADVAKDASEQNGVEHVEDYKFMCSAPGQEMFKKAIREKGLDACIVSASCVGSKLASIPCPSPDLLFLPLCNFV